MAVGALACSCTNEELIIVLFNMCTKETECMLIIGNFILMVAKQATSKQKELTVGADHFSRFCGGNENYILQRSQTVEHEKLEIL